MTMYENTSKRSEEQCPSPSLHTSIIDSYSCTWSKMMSTTTVGFACERRPSTRRFRDTFSLVIPLSSFRISSRTLARSKHSCGCAEYTCQCTCARAPHVSHARPFPAACPISKGKGRGVSD